MNREEINNYEGIGGLDFNPKCEKIVFVKKELTNFRNINKLSEIATIPGRSFGHSLWRFTVHFKDEFDNLKGFKILKYDKTKLSNEGAVRVMWLK